MAWKVIIIKAKPNPHGKDVSSSGSPRPEQLLGEWVDLMNEGNASVYLSSLYLCHVEFSQSCVPAEKPAIYWQGKTTDMLQPQQIVRVHTGKSIHSYLMDEIDNNGVHIHAYAEKGHFVLNNKCGDVISVWWKDANGNWEKEDLTSYDAYPPDGAVLIRRGDKLVPQ